MDIFNWQLRLSFWPSWVIFFNLKSDEKALGKSACALVAGAATPAPRAHAHDQLFLNLLDLRILERNDSSRANKMKPKTAANRHSLIQASTLKEAFGTRDVRPSVEKIDYFFGQWAYIHNFLSIDNFILKVHFLLCLIRLPASPPNLDQLTYRWSRLIVGDPD